MNHLHIYLRYLLVGLGLKGGLKRCENMKIYFAFCIYLYYWEQKGNIRFKQNSEYLQVKVTIRRWLANRSSIRA